MNLGDKFSVNTSLTRSEQGDYSACTLGCAAASEQQIRISVGPGFPYLARSCVLERSTIILLPTAQTIGVGSVKVWTFLACQLLSQEENLFCLEPR